jgi:3',5'-cyclic AMP phosphodiesterase CpdA
MVNVKTETIPPHTQATTRSKQLPQLENFSLAHVSDLHLTSLNHAKVSQLLNKRMLGYFSWRRKRRIAHRLDIVQAMLDDLRITCPDHIAVTGDLTHIGLPEEFVEAGKWLPSLGTPDRVTVIPGNHEAYAGSNWASLLDQWAPYLDSDIRPDSPGKAGIFPSLRIRGPVALIGLCSAHPSLPFLAVGSLGQKQLERLASLLEKTRTAGLFRVILIHHPPVPGSIKWRKRLIDSRAFAHVLARQGAELVLHGHAHAPTLAELPTPAGSIPVIGAPSASELSPWTGNCAKYNIYKMRRVGPNYELTIFVRGYAEDLGRFVAESEEVLCIPHFDAKGGSIKTAAERQFIQQPLDDRMKSDISC